MCPDCRGTGCGLPCRGWTKSCWAGIWAFDFLRHPYCRRSAAPRTERGQPRGKTGGSWADDGNRAKGRLGYCGCCVRTGSGRRLDGRLAVERGASSLCLRSFPTKKALQKRELDISARVRRSDGKRDGLQGVSEGFWREQRGWEEGGTEGAGTGSGGRDYIWVTGRRPRGQVT